jgi:ribose-phosphate pyrophosphokinase
LPLASVHPLFGAAQLNVDVKTQPINTAQRQLSRIKIFSGSAFPELAAQIAAKLGLPLSKSDCKVHNDRHINARIDETVRNTDVVIVQPTCGTPDGPSPSDNLFELQQLILSAKQADARSVTVINPFYGYSRSDRSVKDREVAAAKLATDNIINAGADRIVAGEIHNKAITSFTNKSFKSLKLLPILAQYIKENYDLSNVVVVAPDQGGIKRAGKFAETLGKKGCVGIIDKKRDVDGKLLPDLEYIGNPALIQGKTVILPDDLIDTAGTVCQNANLLMQMGAKEVIVAAPHGFFTLDAIDKINASGITKVITSNSFALGAKAKQCDKITQVSVAPMFAEYISRLFGSDESTVELKE